MYPYHNDIKTVYKIILLNEQGFCLEQMAQLMLKLLKLSPLPPKGQMEVR